MWDYREEVVNEINRDHTNSRYLFGVRLPENISASQKIEEVAADQAFFQACLLLLGKVKSFEEGDSVSLSLKQIKEGINEFVHFSSDRLGDLEEGVDI